MAKKTIHYDGNFHSFLIKNAVIASAITFIIGFQIRSLLSALIDALVKPLFSIDLDRNGQSDLKQIQKYTAKVLGTNFPFGKVLLELVKTLATIFVVYMSVVFLTKYTKLM